MSFIKNLAWSLVGPLCVLLVFAIIGFSVRIMFWVFP